MEKHKDYYFDNNDLINIIVDGIKLGKIIDVDGFYNNKLKIIIDTFNDYLCNNSKNDDVNKTYTEIKTDLSTLKELLKSQEKKSDELEKENSLLERENISLKEENDELKEIKENVYKLVKPKVKNQ